jgi:hypothetical protein
MIPGRQPDPPTRTLVFPDTPEGEPHGRQPEGGRDGRFCAENAGSPRPGPVHLQLRRSKARTWTPPSRGCRPRSPWMPRGDHQPADLQDRAVQPGRARWRRPHLGLLGHHVGVVERPAQAVQRRGHPGVVRPRRVRDVLVGVDRGRRDLGRQPCLVVALLPSAARGSPAKTAFSRSRAVRRCVAMAALAASGSRSRIARAMARCSGLVAAACPAWW